MGLVKKILDSHDELLNFLDLKEVSTFDKLKRIGSYRTGIGWKYLEEDHYKNFKSRQNQINHVSPNNLLTHSYFFEKIF